MGAKGRPWDTTTVVFILAMACVLTILATLVYLIAQEMRYNPVCEKLCIKHGYEGGSYLASPGDTCNCASQVLLRMPPTAKEGE